jgi:hypothetical protein
MYAATATVELNWADLALLERERCARMDEFLTAVSAGWAQVMSFLETCELDREAREILRELQQADFER